MAFVTFTLERAVEASMTKKFPVHIRHVTDLITGEPVLVVEVEHEPGHVFHLEYTPDQWSAACTAYRAAEWKAHV